MTVLGCDETTFSLLLLGSTELGHSSLFNPQRRFVIVLAENMLGVFGGLMTDSISIPHVRHR